MDTTAKEEKCAHPIVLIYLMFSKEQYGLNHWFFMERVLVGLKQVLYSEAQKQSQSLKIMYQESLWLVDGEDNLVREVIW